jgi:hypothetical protein
MMRNGQSAGQATYIAASYYGKDVEDVRFYVAQRGGRSKKKQRSVEGRKYKYFVVAEIIQSCEGSQQYVSGLSVERGISKETVESKFSQADWRFDMAHDTGGYYSSTRFHKALKEFEAKSDAESWLDRNYERIKEKLGY